MKKLVCDHPVGVIPSVCHQGYDAPNALAA